MAYLMEAKNIAYGIRVASLALSGIWYGAGQYITTVEVPARAHLQKATTKVENFQQMFPRMKKMLGKILISCVIGGISQFFLDQSHPGSCYFLASGLCMLAMFPWMKLFILPVNALLISEEALKKNDDWINEHIDKWGNAHFVRTCLGGIGFALNILAFLM